MDIETVTVGYPIPSTIREVASLADCTVLAVYRLIERDEVVAIICRSSDNNGARFKLTIDTERERERERERAGRN